MTASPVGIEKRLSIQHGGRKNRPTGVDSWAQLTWLPLSEMGRLTTTGVPEAIAIDSSYMNYKEDTWRHWEGCDEAMDGTCLYRQELEEEWAPLHAWVQMQVW